MYYLVVVQAFLGYARGDVIRDTETIETILGSEQSAHVVRIDAVAHTLS